MSSLGNEVCQLGDDNKYGTVSFKDVNCRCCCRPLYCTSMRGLAVCFSGYRPRENKGDLRRLLFQIHSMGGRVLKDVNIQKPKVTHLVAKDCRGEKYTYATTFDIPVMQGDWIDAAWQMRGQVRFKVGHSTRRRNASAPSFLQAGFSADSSSFREMWKAKPFHGAHVHFLGFSESEHAHMVEELVRNGGKECADYRREPCTHVVVNDDAEQTKPKEVSRALTMKCTRLYNLSIKI